MNPMETARNVVENADMGNELKSAVEKLLKHDMEEDSYKL